jgi:hypothetical protein
MCTSKLKFWQSSFFVPGLDCERVRQVQQLVDVAKLKDADPTPKTPGNPTVVFCLGSRNFQFSNKTSIGVNKYMPPGPSSNSDSATEAPRSHALSDEIAGHSIDAIKGKQWLAFCKIRG